MLLLVKPSDKNKFKTEFEDQTKNSSLRRKNKELFDFFNLEYKNYVSAEISLEKLLKVLLAFVRNGFEAYKNGCNVLKQNSQIYKNFLLTSKST